MLLLAGFLLVGLIVLDGCKKSEPAAPPESEEGLFLLCGLQGEI